MKCPKCKGRVYITDVANNDTDHEIYRRRKCNDCGEVFYTVEFEAVYNDSFKKAWNEYRR